MYFTKNQKKKVNLFKVILITATIAAAIAAVATALMFWKKKCSADQEIENEIDAAIDAALAEEESEAVEVDVTDAEI